MPFRTLHSPVLGLVLALGLTLGSAARAHATFGADVLIASVEPAFGTPNVDVAFTPDGVGYGAIGYGVATPLEIHVDVYRSIDDGESWQLLDTVVLPSISEFGVVNDVHVAFSTAPTGEAAVMVIAGANPPDAIYWAWAPLAGGTFSSPVEFDFCTSGTDLTADSFGNLYMTGFCDSRVSVAKYVAESGWTPSFDIVTEVVSASFIDTGDDDRVHLTWRLTGTGDTIYTASTPNPGGPTDFASPVILPTHPDLVSVRDVEAFGGSVYVAESLGSAGARYVWSDDGGVTWPNERIVSAFPLNVPSVLEVDSGVLLGNTEPSPLSLTISRGPTPNVTSVWRVFEDTPFNLVEATPHFEVNPKWGGVGSMFLTPGTPSSVFDVYFDAEWREAGYLSKSEWVPATFIETEELDPAMANFDDDPEPEIFYVDGNFEVNVVNGDGSPVGPWPLSSDGAWPNFAIGDIDVDGDNEVVWGGSDEVWAYHHDGTLVSGYPFILPGSNQNWVSIGNLNGANAVIVNTGTHLHAIVNGVELSGFPHAEDFALNGRGTASAVGDIDGDGINEIVSMFARDDGGLAVAALNADGSILWQRNLEENAPVWKQAPVIAKLDPEFELPRVLLVSLENSTDYWLRGLNGDTGADTELVDFPRSGVTSFAVADIRGSSVPEIVAIEPDGDFGTWRAFDPSSAWSVFAYTFTSNPSAAPIVEIAETPLILVKADYHGDSFPNAITAHDPVTGDQMWGTPMPLPGAINETPASGDVDGDGAAEVFVQSGGAGYLFEFVGSIDGPSSRMSLGLPHGRWPMAGGNPSRTHCYECIDDVVAAPDGDPEAGSLDILVSAPRPNPTSSATTIGFAITELGEVTIGVFDVRGRSVFQQNLGVLIAGSHSVVWDGRGESGERMPPGAYFLSIRRNGADLGGPRRVLIVR